MAWYGLDWPGWPGARKWPGWPGKFFVLHRIFKGTIFPGVFFDEKAVALIPKLWKIFLDF